MTVSDVIVGIFRSALTSGTDRISAAATMTITGVGVLRAGNARYPLPDRGVEGNDFRTDR